MDRRSLAPWVLVFGIACTKTKEPSSPPAEVAEAGPDEAGAASAEDAAGANVDGANADATNAEAEGGPGASCAADADCKIVSSYCGTCACLPMAFGAMPAKCDANEVKCLVDPCMKQIAKCVDGRCSAVAAP